MAHMIPPFPPPPGPGYRAEWLLYEALRAQLDDDFFVYNGLKFIEPKHASEGEADFLVLHREKGMLAIECKGGGVRRDGTGQWVRMIDGKEKPLDESPFEQAQRTIKTLVDQLRTGTRKAFPRLTRFPFVHGHAVAFPLALKEEANLPLDVPGEILWDASELSRIGERVEGAFRHWKKAAAGGVALLEPFEFRNFRRKLLHPHINVAESLGASIMADEQAVIQLSEEQVRVVDTWMDNRRLRVKGGAGTGKTLLALEAAKRLAEQGESVLLLCFNKALKNFLQARVGRMDLDKRFLRAAHFHGLCTWAHWQKTDAKPEVPKDKEAGARYWKEEAPYFLLDAIADGKVVSPSALVIDEGQDFAETWWEVLDELIGANAKGRMLVFYDASQTIFGEKCCVPEMPTITLKQNFRNTKRIAELVCRLGRVDMTTFERCPEGEPPEIRKQESPGRASAQTAELLKRLVNANKILPEQITILTPHTRDNSIFSGLDELGGFRLAADPLNRAGAVLHTTIGSFKGLESDVIILADIDPDDPRSDRNSLYVAASRAKHRLFVFTRGEWAE